MSLNLKVTPKFKKYTGPVIILVIGIILSTTAYFFIKNESKSRAQREYALHCEDIKLKILNRLNVQEEYLRNLASFITISDSVNSSDWKFIIQKRKTYDSIQEAQSFAYNILISKNQLQQHIQAIRSEGFDNYTVKPVGDRNFYTPIIYIEPFEGRNLKAFGFDTYSEPVRKKAMEKARDFDIATLTGKLILVQESAEDSEAGSIMYVPVYKRNRPLNTVEERRNAIKGWTSNPFRMNDLMKDIFTIVDSIDNQKIHLKVFDGEIESNKSLLFDSQLKEDENGKVVSYNELILPLKFNTNIWTLHFSQENVQFYFYKNSYFIVLISGLAISFLLYALLLSLFNTGKFAKRFAEKLTFNLLVENKEYLRILEENKKFFSAIEQSANTIVITDTEGNIEYTNPKFTEVTGYSAEEALGKNPSILSSGTQPKEYYAKMWQTISTGDVWKGEFQNKHKNGTFFMEQVTISPIKNTNGEITNYLAIKENISALKKSEQIYQVLIDKIPDGVYKSTEEGKFISVNPAMVKMLGYTSEEELMAIDIKTDLYFDLDDRENLTLDELNKELGVFRVKKKDGSELWVEDHGWYTNDASGNILFHEGIMRDITERIALERTTQIKKERVIRLKNAISNITLKNITSLDNQSLSFKMLTEEAAIATEISQVGIWLFSEDEEVLVCKSQYNSKNKEHTVGMEILRKDFPNYFQTLFEKSNLNAFDAQNDPQTFEFKENYLIPNNIKSLYDKVIIIDGELKGVVCFENIGEKMLWESDQDSFANTIAAMVSQTIINEKRRQTQKELNNALDKAEESEQQKTVLFERLNEAQLISKIGSWDYNITTGYVWWSEELYAICELDPKIFTPSRETNSIIIHPDDVDSYRNAINEAIETGKQLISDVRVLTLTGKIKYCKSQAKVFFDENKKAVRMSGTFSDITEQVLLNKELILAKEKAEENGEKFWSLLNFAPDAFFHGDEKGNFIEVNEQSSVLTGYSNKELLKMNFSDLFSKEELAKKPLRYDLVNDKKVVINKRALRRKNGSLINVEMKSKQMPNGYYQSFIVDLTEREKLEHSILDAKEKTEESEARFKALHNASFGGIAIHNKGIILDCNQGLSEISGYTEIELRGMNGLLLISEKYRDLVMKNILTSYELPYEVVGIRKNEEEYPLRIEGRTIPYKGETVRVAEFRDITKQKEIELALIVAKEKAEESDRLKSAFISNMSHEIRTPMNGILGFAGLLKSRDLSSDQQQKYIRVIEKSGARLLTTINDIMDISKIESGLMNISLSEININEQIEELYTFFKPEADKKGLQLLLVNALSEDESIVKTDEDKVHAILVNLIKNAIKFTKQGSVELGCSKNENELDFYVKDTGIGIPLDRQPYVFDRFVQADIEDKAVYEGSGLGLAISKSYVKMLGGTIELESTEGIGSIVRFTIPCQPITKIITSARNKLSTDFKASEIPALKILIVEDDIAAQLYLEELLTDVSKEILLADNGYKALEICHKNLDIDLILMDIRMPGINGYEVTHKIRQFNKEVVIIAQTAFALSGDKEKSLDAGCNDYISKPINKDHLVALIQKYFNK